MNVGTWRRITLMLLAGLIAGWFAILRPELNARELAEDEAERLASRLAAHRATAARHDEWRERVAALSRQIRIHPMRLPREPDLPGLLGRVAGVATTTGTRLVGVEPESPVATADYRQRAVTLRLTGEWNGLVDMLTRLDHETRAITMNRLTLTRRNPEAKGPPLTLTLTVTGYWQTADGAFMPSDTGPAGWMASDPGTAGDRPAALARNPFGSRPVGLERVADGLTYLGRIQVGDQVWALVRDASGTIHARQSGTVLPGGGKLERVTPTAIIIHRPGTGGNHGKPVTRQRIALDDSGEG